MLWSWPAIMVPLRGYGLLHKFTTTVFPAVFWRCSTKIRWYIPSQLDQPARGNLTFPAQC